MELDPNELFFWEPIALAGTPFEINRVVLLMFVASAACLLFFLLGSRRGALVPRGIQNLAETAYLFVRNNIAIDVIGPEGTKYAGYLAAVFYFIFFANLLEIIPGINFPVTSRMAIPAALAFLSYVVFITVGIIKHGPISYFRGVLFPPGVPKPIYILLTPIEIFSTFVFRPLTLAIRLLANMMAGHVLLTIFFLFTAEFFRPDITLPLGFATAIVAAGLILFELLVITIQAYIFTTLTAFYISESIHGHGPEEAESHGEEADTGGARAQRETEGIAA
jgi:F-type H+-transporting ATPase subunit a